VLACLDDNAPTCSSRVARFESEFAEFCTTKHAIAVTSATAGLMLAGVGINIQPGDEVITTPISWIATANAFKLLGAEIRFCDVDPRTMNLDPGALGKLINSRTKAVVPVHLYGQCCDMEAICAIAEDAKVAVVEDCAHAPGATFNGRKAGSFGDAGVFSFHQQKNMATLGEGGMLTTNSDEVYARAMAFRSHCYRVYGSRYTFGGIDESERPMGKQYWWQEFDDVGYNFRMTDIQGAVGSVQLAKLNAHNSRRTELAQRLMQKLSDVANVVTPFVDQRATHVFHLFPLFLSEDHPLGKDEFIWRMLHEHGIKAWSHYIPIDSTAVYRRMGHSGVECPVANRMFQRLVRLPIHPRLTDEAIDYMAGAIRTLSS
ncbi:MAG: DegT/DnrJ/EryC1/StrS family aminotransferase, partial [Caldilineaceae bacterium]|nr:DegT/DnrJ/EryC1/StrS family aminotransferase [Caldilineaceae bacterium]